MGRRSTISPTDRSPERSTSTTFRRVGSARESKTLSKCITMHIHGHTYRNRRGSAVAGPPPTLPVAPGGAGSAPRGGNPSEPREGTVRQEDPEPHAGDEGPQLDVEGIVEVPPDLVESNDDRQRPEPPPDGAGHPADLPPFQGDAHHGPSDGEATERQRQIVRVVPIRVELDGPEGHRDQSDGDLESPSTAEGVPCGHAEGKEDHGEVDDHRRDPRGELEIRHAIPPTRPATSPLPGGPCARAADRWRCGATGAGPADVGDAADRPRSVPPPGGTAVAPPEGH